MAAPTFVSATCSGGGTTFRDVQADTHTVSVTVQTGDRLVAIAANGDGSAADFFTGGNGIAGGGLTWTLQEGADFGSQQPEVAIWTATATSNATFSVTLTSTNSTTVCGFVVQVWRGSDGIGAHARADNGTGSGSASLSLTTTGANSAISAVYSDWNATTGTQTWATINGASEVTDASAAGDGATYGAEAVHWTDAGAAGSKTVSLTAPSSSLRYNIAAIEILGSGGGGGGPAPISLRAAGTATGATAAVTAVNPSVPTGTTTGDLSVLTVWAKPYNTTIGTPSGWTKIGEHTNGTTAAGTDTGSTKVAVFVRESATPGAIGNLTLTNANSAGAVIHSYAKESTYDWDVSAFTQGADAANGANYSATGAAGISVAEGDRVVASTAVCGDVGTVSAQAIGGMSGATLGTVANRTNAAVTTGTDTRGLVSDIPVSSGSSSAAPTFTYTNASSTSGTTIWLRLRQAAGTTPVSKAMSTTWNVVGRVTAARSTLWNVLENLTPVSASRSTLWNARAYVGTASSTLWHSRSYVSQARSTQWHVNAQVSAARSTLWHNLTTIGAPRSTLWNVLTSASASRSTLWNVRAQVSAARSTLWNVDGTLAAVSRAVSTTWHTLAQVGQSSSTQWHVLRQVSQGRSTLWHVLQQVSTSRSTLWNVLGNLTQVSRALSTTWNVAAQVAQSRSTSWNVASIVSAARSTTWNVLRVVTQARSTLWHVRAYVSRSRSTLWNVRARVAASRSTSWNVEIVLTAVSKAISTRWHVAAQVAAERSTRWNVQQIITTAMSTRWAVRILVRRFTPPAVEPGPAWSLGGLGKFYRRPRSASILITGTSYVQKEMPSELEIAAADLFYGGGRTYEVTEEEAAAIEAAGLTLEVGS